MRPRSCTARSSRAISIECQMDDVTKTSENNGGAPYGRFGSGKPVRRVEDADLLVGRGRFADDVSAPNQVFACFLRSPHPHARIVAIDKAAAEKMPGVIGIVTGDDLVGAGVKPLPNSADFKRPDGKPLSSPLHHALAVGTVRFVGEAVAVVLAQTREQAQDAVDAIDVRYDDVFPAARFVQVRQLAARLGQGARQHRGGSATRQRLGNGGCVPSRRPYRFAGYCQPTRRAMSDRTARAARELRRSDRSDHDHGKQPDAGGFSRHAVRRGVADTVRKGARPRRRCRRRLRHEDGLVSGGCRDCVVRAQIRAAGQVAGRSHRRVSCGDARARCGNESRPCSR